MLRRETVQKCFEHGVVKRSYIFTHKNFLRVMQTYKPISHILKELSALAYLYVIVLYRH